MRNFLIFALALAVSSPSFACSFDTARPFTPSLKTWARHPGPGQTHENSDGPYWEPIPTPVVRVVKVTRGSAAPGMSCADAGTIELEVSLPSSSTYNIGEFGVYFRVKSGRLPDEIFPSIPLKGEIKDGRMRIFLAWLDGSPKHQFPLHLRVESFLITNDLHIGKSSFFLVKAGIGG